MISKEVIERIIKIGKVEPKTFDQRLKKLYEELGEFSAESLKLEDNCTYKKGDPIDLLAEGCDCSIVLISLIAMIMEKYGFDSDRFEATINGKLDKWENKIVDYK